LSLTDDPCDPSSPTFCLRLKVPIKLVLVVHFQSSKYQQIVCPSHTLRSGGFSLHVLPNSRSQQKGMTRVLFAILIVFRFTSSMADRQTIALSSSDDFESGSDWTDKAKVAAAVGLPLLSGIILFLHCRGLYFPRETGEGRCCEVMCSLVLDASSYLA